MSRYQAPACAPVRWWLSAAAGAGIPLVLLISLGSLLAAGDPTLADAGDPVAAIRAMLPTWMAVPYLIAAFGGLLLSNHLSVYSAGLTTLTLGVRVRRVYAVVVDVIVTFAGAIYFMLIADGFYGPFIAFISASRCRSRRGSECSPSTCCDAGTTTRTRCWTRAVPAPTGTAAASPGARSARGRWPSSSATCSPHSARSGPMVHRTTR